MGTYYYALDQDNEYLFDNFPVDCVALVSEYNGSLKPFEIYWQNKKVAARMGKKTHPLGTIYTLTTESKYINRQKLFLELLEFSTIVFKPLKKLQADIINTQISRTEEFVHNVTSLSTYSIQSLFTLIPPKTLTGSINAQTENIKNIVAEKPKVTVKTLLQLIKYNLAMKIEFSVYDLTLLPNTPQKNDHSIREIILSVLQIFIEDFEDKKIEVTLDACEKRLNVNHDSLTVTLYYIFENAVKYSCPRTKFKIRFAEEKDGFSILFDMISIRIEPGEVNRLTERGFRSPLAVKHSDAGKGIGMFRILKTLKLNNAILEIMPRTTNFVKKIGPTTFEGNLFKVKFIGQQDWFAS